MRPNLAALALALTAAASIAAAAPHHAGPPATAADHAVDASALAGPFAIGTEVRDASGAVMGRITRMGADKDGRSQIMVRKGVDSFAIPAGEVSLRDGVAVSARSRDELKRGR